MSFMALGWLNQELGDCLCFFPLWKSPKTFSLERILQIICEWSLNVWLYFCNCLLPCAYLSLCNQSSIASSLYLFNLLLSIFHWLYVFIDNQYDYSFEIHQLIRSFISIFIIYIIYWWHIEEFIYSTVHIHIV